MHKPRRRAHRGRGPRRPVHGGPPGGARRPDAGLRGACPGRRPGPLHRRALGRQLSQVRSSGQRHPQSAEHRAIRVAGRDSGRLRDAVSAGDGHRSAGVRSSAGGSGDRCRRRGPGRCARVRARDRCRRRQRDHRRRDGARPAGGARLRRELRVSAAVWIRLAARVPAHGAAGAAGEPHRRRRAAFRPARRARRVRVGGAGACVPTGRTCAWA